jgi:hypothetical protein
MQPYRQKRSPATALVDSSLALTFRLTEHLDRCFKKLNGSFMIQNIVRNPASDLNSIGLTREFCPATSENNYLQASGNDHALRRSLIFSCSLCWLLLQMMLICSLEERPFFAPLATGVKKITLGRVAYKFLLTRFNRVF